MNGVLYTLQKPKPKKEKGKTELEGTWIELIYIINMKCDMYARTSAKKKRNA